MPFSHIVFDLDETLYDRRTGLMDEISRRITLWLQERLSLSPRKPTRSDSGTSISTGQPWLDSRRNGPAR